MRIFAIRPRVMRGIALVAFPLLFGLASAPSSGAEEGAQAVQAADWVRYPDGGRYRGPLRDDQRHGRGYYRYPSGDQYLGDWENDKKQGQGRYVWSSGNYYEGGWANGLQQGHGLVIHADGALIEGSWEAGKLVDVERTEGPTSALRARLETAKSELAAAGEVFPPSCELNQGLWIKPEKEMIWNDQVEDLSITVIGLDCHYRKRVDGREGFFNDGFVHFTGLGNGRYEVVIEGAGARKGPFRISAAIRHPGMTDVVCDVDLVEEVVQCRNWGPED